MSAASNILAEIRRAAAVKIIFLPHALRQMSRPDRMILAADVRRVVESGVVLEDYPEDARGHSCLLMGRLMTIAASMWYARQKMNTSRLSRPMCQAPPSGKAT